MDKETRAELIEALADFVIRVAKGKHATETDLQVLASVARLLLELT